MTPTAAKHATSAILTAVQAIAATSSYQSWYTTQLSWTSVSNYYEGNVSSVTAFDCREQLLVSTAAGYD